MSNTPYRSFDPWRPSPVKEESRKEILDSHYFSVDHVAFHSPEVGHFERYLLREHHGDTVAILALTDDGRIPFIEQYRIPTHRWTLEIPAGHANHDNERPAEVASRKLKEEVGYEAHSLTQFMRFINTPSFSTQHTALFYASELTAVEPSSVGPETPRPEIRLYTPEEAYDMVSNGTIIDAKSVIALLQMQHGLLSQQ